MPGWDWVARARVLDGRASLEMFDELLAAGESALPLLVDVASRRDWREGDAWDLREVPAHALRALGELRSERVLPVLMGVLVDPGDHALHGQEAALALARQGEPALPHLQRLLLSRERDTWARIRAANALAFAALRDRRLRPRVRSAYERLLHEPQERDRLVVSSVIDLACKLAMTALLPAVTDAHGAGRADPDWGQLRDIQLDLIARHHRPDAELKALARRDPRDEYVPLAAMLEPLDEALRGRVLAALAEASRATAPPDGD